MAYSLPYGHRTERAHGFPSDDSTDLKPPYNFHMANQGINGGAERERNRKLLLKILTWNSWPPFFISPTNLVFFFFNV